MIQSTAVIPSFHVLAFQPAQDYFARVITPVVKALCRAIRNIQQAIKQETKTLVWDLQNKFSINPSIQTSQLQDDRGSSLL